MTGSRLDHWRDLVTAADDACAWPGPRPLEDRDLARFPGLGGQLAGRVQDSAGFRREVDYYQLVFLTGPSGVGKTSLLRAGLVPSLESTGRLVGVCRDWSRVPGTSPAAFLVEKLHEQYQVHSQALTRGPSMFFELDTEFGDRAVIVLDQFEEVLLWDKQMQNGLFELILALTRQTRLKFVLSFRREFLHEMRALEQRAGAYTMSHYYLGPVAADEMIDVVRAPNTPDRAAITEEAAHEVDRLWQLASADGVGLLHLQALLYALSHLTGHETVGLDAVTAFTAGRSPRQLFEGALVRSVEIKLQSCRDAAREVGLDPYLIEGTTHLLSRCVQHLSSAGYKLVREVAELAEVTLGDDLDSLLESAERAHSPVSPGQLRALLTSVLSGIGTGRGQLDLLSVSAEELAKRADTAAPQGAGAAWAARLTRVEGEPADPTDATCGPMLGMPAVTVLMEELRRFGFGLAWLDASSLARLIRSSDDESRVSLVHDGFAAALDHWSDELRGAPEGVLHAVTAPRGAAFVWPSDDEGRPAKALDGGDGVRLLTNLRWRGDTVIAHFRRVAFVNCDLRGAYFRRCRFEGVTFVNCRLDGVLLTDCEVVGAPGEGDDWWDPAEPTFQLAAEPGLLDALHRYRGAAPTPGTTLVSRPGEPAVPSTGDEGRPLTPKVSGLAVYGGRVSSFVLRRTSFPGGGAFAMRHVAGSGLDVVEQASGTFEITGCALRHVAFTRAPSAEDSVEDTSSVADSTGLTVSARLSLLSQIWVGAGLSGSVSLDDCTVLQAWNSSSGVRATITASGVHDCVGFDIDETCTPLSRLPGAASPDAVDGDGSLRLSTRRMDYRST